MAEPVPRVYFFYGDEELAIREAVDRLRTNLGETSTADLNTQRFLTSQLDLTALEEACATAPFLAPRRLVILDEWDRAPQDPDWTQRFLDLLESVPPTTALVIIERVTFRRAQEEGKWRGSSRLLKWAEKHEGAAFVRSFRRPKGPAFVQWLRKRSKSLGGEIEPAAANLLAEWVAEDTSLANQELEKLLEYVDRSRPVSAGDVERLTPYYVQTDVFAMVDAVGQRDAQKALELLDRLLQKGDIRYAFSMIVRQFRLLLQARESLDAGRSVSKDLPIHPFVAGKIADQAKNFSLPHLERIHHGLLDIDLASKTGKADLEVSLQSLIAKLASQVEVQT